ncbi:6-phosphofructokinase [Anaerosphaera aminiphila DSM 21120]|uniref:ATP-dependent 6-phosphofructokinase n=1 Tax=Anaerosphaera aminiphila DSM 21120 TaxID=1120995 RepID=A0A1M5U726_9FIRM|nr:ATP-dependent 6-phosphofructokinase [Anaerosphaera aminiphila]SHH58764.1 6-phosphofructokinase [Anaerosphaera aminiphila DSM 21120]
MDKIAILTSGGDAPGMNAVIRAVVRTAIYYGIEVYGIKNGYEGLIDGEVEQLIESSVADIIQRGGTVLGTSRSERFITHEGFNQAIDVLKKYGINKVIVGGGDGSLRGAKKLSESGIDVVGIPLSIDNDLGFTDYSIGFFTAITTVTNAISNIRDTTESHGRANVVEVMGRDCGDIALYSGIAGGAENIIVPEKKYEISEIAKKAIVGKNRGKRHHIIIMAEGAGNSYEFAEKFEELTGIDTKVTILGYIQRGGSPSVVDRILGSTMGNVAVEHILKNTGGYVMSIREGSVKTYPIGDALKMENKFDEKLSEILKIISI